MLSADAATSTIRKMMNTRVREYPSAYDVLNVLSVRSMKVAQP